MKFILDNLSLVLAVLVSGGMLLWPLMRARAGGPTLDTLEATKLLNSREVQVVDCRTAAEFSGGSLEHARNLPVTEIGRHADELRKDVPVLLICGHGRRSSIASVKLRSAGVKEVYILGGGMQAWRAAGLPVSK